MTRLGLLALNGYRSGVIDILIGNVCNIGWCIVGRQAIWWEGMLALDLHKMGATRTSQCFASLTYNIQDWMIYLIKAKWVSRVHLSGDTFGNDCSHVDLLHFSHTHHGFHHCDHLLLHSLHVGLHLFLYLLYFAHHFSFGTCSV